MLKHRLIPNIILNDGNVVQSKNFIHTNIIGNAITAVDFFNSWASDEIIILDVSRNKNKRKEFHQIINNISKEIKVTKIEYRTILNFIKLIILDKI